MKASVASHPSPASKPNLESASMTAPAQRAAEPSMEEILASIRRIIADDQSRAKLTPAKLVSVTDRAGSERPDASVSAEPAEAGLVENDPAEADEAEAGFAEESFASAELPAPEPVEAAPPQQPIEGKVSKPDFSKPNVAELALVRAKERDGEAAAELDVPATEAAVLRPAPAVGEAQADVSREAAPDGMRAFASAERGYRTELPRPQLRPTMFSAKIEPVLDASPAAEAAPAPVAPAPATADEPVIEEMALPSAAMSHEPAPLPQAVLQPMLPQVRAEAYPAPVSGVAVEARPAELRNEIEQPRQRDASAMLSGEADAAIARAFNSLSRTVLSENARTLEDLVREMLRPMLKAWLDDNLPPLVERLVRAEIERVARGRPV